MAKQRHPYEVFNARNLTPEEVAESFVPPEEFDELWSKNHTVLMGPRGSGKTTLLKMLTLPALNSWNQEQAAYIRKHIGFTAVYIPTDIHWHHQLLHARYRLESCPDVLQLFSVVAMTTNVLTALATSMGYVIRYEYLNSREEEAALSELLIREWRLGPAIPSLAGINEAMKSRINDMYTQMDRLTRGRISSAELPDYFSLDYLAATTVACAAFDRIFQSEYTNTRKWALCFDELELAPQWLQDRLFAELRSTDERYIFKLSTSPIPNLISATAASPGHDFTVIRLWPHKKKDFRLFCQRLTSAILSKHGLTVSPQALFGTSLLASQADAKEYNRGSRTWRIMRDWAKFDRGFRTVLEKAAISYDDPTTQDPQKRDQVLRKAKPLVLLRHTFLKIDGSGTRRSRKVPTIYSGENAIYDISEGNPRLLIGIVNDTLSKYHRKPSLRQIPRATQASVLTSASKQFGDLIRSLPEATAVVNNTSVQLYTLLEQIGHYFFETMLLEPFTLDPSGSFFVDPATPEELHPMLKKAVYHGALVLVDPADDPFDSQLSGKRFRISYILAPSFKLPLRLYDSVPLSSCLRGRKHKLQQELKLENQV